MFYNGNLSCFSYENKLYRISTNIPLIEIKIKFYDIKTVTMLKYT